MSEIMYGLSFPALVTRIQEEYAAKGSVFGIAGKHFFLNEKYFSFRLQGHELSSPMGPAAGPNAQLAQNIVASYLCGGRFMELKTVQTMDGKALRDCVARPCINAADEGYNVEWSTELTTEEAFEEYVKAWFLLHVFAKEFNLSEKMDFMFNMSVGYDLAGIKSEKIDGYIEGMKNAENTGVFRTCKAWLAENMDRFSRFNQDDLEKISGQISNSITLSTLHGCPQEEIEQIARYLLTEKHLHTYVKCNPTLLGYADARRILDGLGFDYIAFDDHHFNEDLSYADAVPMLRRLMDEATGLGLTFGVKITNTFPVDIKKSELPGEEMYMSGRALFPLSVTAASRLGEAFEGKLPISYSGGADYFNLEELLAVGIRPITVATTILKPGGYARFRQLADLAADKMDAGMAVIDTAKLSDLAVRVAAGKLPRHTKSFRVDASRKLDEKLSLFDCFTAPCSAEGCPISQQIPAYLEKVAEGKYDEAFAIIAKDNPAPSITGEICDHQCQSKCTRMDVDEPLRIRQAKCHAAREAQDAYTKNVKPAPIATDKKALIIGAGPSGIAAASFLRMAGMAVTVREERNEPFGVVAHVIPEFRISPEALERDFATSQARGVNYEFGVRETRDASTLRKEYDFVIVATGAWKEGQSDLPIDGEKVRDALTFLADSKASGLQLALGRRVAVIGGGDVAMDCARAAKRNEGVEDAVLIYRRTKEWMPAQREEIELALADGVTVMELRAPKEFSAGQLTVELMELSGVDASGRAAIKGTGKTETLAFDTVVSAVGARVDVSWFAKSGLSVTEKGYAALNASFESSEPGVYIVGDCSSGASTVVRGMADAKAAAAHILEQCGLTPSWDQVRPASPIGQWAEKKGILENSEDAAGDAGRCLGCNILCEICVDVCPNRANESVVAEGFGDCHQVVHTDAACNECGNCAIFCPKDGRPYQDKFTLFTSEADFRDSANRGILKQADGSWLMRLPDGAVAACSADKQNMPEDYARLLGAIEQNSRWLFAM